MSRRDFQDHVAVVTGAASGIGLAVAQRFAEEGASVALWDRDEKRGFDATAQLRSTGAICEFFPVDVGVEEELLQAATQVTRRFRRVDHLVNNAGVVIVKGVEECTSAEWTTS